MAEKFINGSGLQHVIGKIKTDFVAKESGKNPSEIIDLLNKVSYDTRR
jgi:hypothetical protein